VVYKYHLLTQITKRGAKRQKKKDICVKAIRGSQKFHKVSLCFHIAVYKGLTFFAYEKTGSTDSIMINKL